MTKEQARDFIFNLDEGKIIIDIDGTHTLICIGQDTISEHPLTEREMKGLYMQLREYIDPQPEIDWDENERITPENMPKFMAKVAEAENKGKS